MKRITIQDESATGKILNELLLELEQEVITVKELIRLRVKSEVDRYNTEKEERFQGLVQPTALEERLNQSQSKKRLVDAEKQFYVAMEAFQNNGFFVLIDNQQVTDPEEEVIITDHTSVSFIKLTPLVGG
ncbi:MAG: hypothetical protein ACPGJS_04400 [Flammeovirgaceae bacterium]